MPFELTDEEAWLYACRVLGEALTAPCEEATPAADVVARLVLRGRGEDMGP